MIGSVQLKKKVLVNEANIVIAIDLFCNFVIWLMLLISLQVSQTRLDIFPSFLSPARNLPPQGTLKAISMLRIIGMSRFSVASHATDGYALLRNPPLIA